MGDGRGRLLKDTLLYLLLLLQGLHERRFEPVGVLGFQRLLLIGRHTVLTEDGPALCLVLPPAAGEVGAALGAGEGFSGIELRRRDARLP